MNMNKTELLRVAEILETKVTDEQFDMQIFHCGTKGCAVGWYCTHHKCDLKLEPACMEPTYKGRTNFGAISAYFGIGHNDAFWLFGGATNSGLSREDIIEKIRRFCEQN